MSAPATPRRRGTDVIDWAAVRDETVAHLRRLIRIVTVNPPGNELEAARYLDGVLTGAGIQTRLFETAPGRAVLAATLKGSGAREPLLLLAHMDVVGADPAAWSTDPFGGEVRGGYVYGRGAIDDKGMLAANLMAMLLLKRHHVDAGEPLARDVVFLATADEEESGAYGLGWIIEHRPELLRAELALNEGGRTRVVGGRALYMAVQTAEKVPHVLRLTARGTGGHGSIPLRDNAIVRLGRALAAVGAHREPLQLVPTTRAFFRDLSAVWPVPDEARAMADVAADDPGRAARGAAALAEIPVLDALLRNGISPVVVRGGARHNVIPPEASALLDVRTLPGEPLAGVIERLRAAIGDPAVTIEVEQSEAADAPSSPIDSPMFEALRASVHAIDPGIAVVPYLSTGATDSAKLRALGIQAYGILPFPMEQGDEARMHGHDERVPVESLAFGTRVIYEAVRRVAR
ncbi:MAG TPA: M20/M25/M40 family metallo-hydrolase [Gemmatimonadaceae bacterium]|nr:M20/M25/M40 family metallo-hydrolase [Gemmatimonadaceae bacterium]